MSKKLLELHMRLENFQNLYFRYVQIVVNKASTLDRNSEEYFLATKLKKYSDDCVRNIFTEIEDNYVTETNAKFIEGFINCYTFILNKTQNDFYVIADNLFGIPQELKNELIKKEKHDMKKESILAMKKARLANLENIPKNVKCPGVVKKLRREIRNLEK